MLDIYCGCGKGPETKLELIREGATDVVTWKRRYRRTKRTLIDDDIGLYKQGKKVRRWVRVKNGPPVYALEFTCTKCKRRVIVADYSKAKARHKVNCLARKGKVNDKSSNSSRTVTELKNWLGIRDIRSNTIMPKDVSVPG